MNKISSSYVNVIAILIIGVCSIGCGPSEALQEEAYDAGWNSAWNELCRDVEPPSMMPSKYDDSMGSGELVGYYRAGIADAKANPNLCN